MKDREELELEELIPIVALLVEKFTSKESTSVSYDTARQLMGAVVYCINEAENAPEAGEQAGLMKCDKEERAKRLYDRGCVLVMEKVIRAKQLYEELIDDFNAYGNRCCYDTIVKGMPAFFRAYDVRYNPQNHRLTLDYPILEELGNMCGIDAIYRYLECVKLEQSFLSMFSEGYVKSVIGHIYHDGGELLINLSAVMMRNTVGHLLLKKPIMGEGFTAAEYEELSTQIMTAAGELKVVLAKGVSLIAEQCCGGEQLTNYLLKDVKNFEADLKNAAEHGCLERVLGY